jgi:hypothetical protein
MLLGILLVPTVGLVGDIVTDGKFKSSRSTAEGPPLEVDSSAMVANLNADQLDGLEGTDLYTQAEVDELVASAVETVRQKRYFVTMNSYSATSATSACGTGYHMANLFEISQPSSLLYAYDDARAWSFSEIGQGPPSGVHGWIKSGYSYPSTSSTPGYGNCNNWGSFDDAHRGTVARLPHDFSDPAPSGAGWALVWGTPWGTITKGCDESHPVWCVED